MKAKNFILQKYFDRIGFTGSAKADISTVTEMMRRQLFTVPFENLDVQAGKIVSLVPEEIVEKIIDRKRGGYCYEVNGLFTMALEELGVTWQLVGARPMFYPTRRPKTHMVVVVTFQDEKWLCDTGFGRYGLRAPLRLDLVDTPVVQDHDTYMIDRPNDHEYILKALCDDGRWENQYSFDLSPTEWVDFVPANYFNSTHPDAIFVQKLLVVLHTLEGRQILLGDELKTLYKGKTEKKIIDRENRNLILKNIFNLTVE